MLGDVRNALRNAKRRAQRRSRQAAKEGRLDAYALEFDGIAFDIERCIKIIEKSFRHLDRLEKQHKQYQEETRKPKDRTAGRNTGRLTYGK